MIYERADADKPHMGLTTWAAAPEGKIVKSDVSIAKNYDVRESNIMKICKGMDVTPFELFQTDKKVLVINDPKEINVILKMRYLPEEYRERLSS